MRVLHNLPGNSTGQDLVLPVRSVRGAGEGGVIDRTSHDSARDAVCPGGRRQSLSPPVILLDAVHPGFRRSDRYQQKRTVRTAARFKATARPLGGRRTSGVAVLSGHMPPTSWIFDARQLQGSVATTATHRADRSSVVVPFQRRRDGLKGLVDRACKFRTAQAARNGADTSSGPVWPVSRIPQMEIAPP
jgi:hypothetical protein